MQAKVFWGKKGLKRMTVSSYSSARECPVYTTHNFCPTPLRLQQRWLRLGISHSRLGTARPKQRTEIATTIAFFGNLAKSSAIS